MASGPTEKQRYIEGKVYRRRVFKGHKKNPNFGDTVDSATAITTVTNDTAPKNNTATVNNDAPPPQLAEDASTAQLQDSSRLEDGNSPQKKLEGQNLAQQEVGSRTGDGNLPQSQLEDKNSAQQQESLINGDGNSPQKKLEDENLSQPIESSRTEDRDSPQQRLEEQNLAQPPESSRTEDRSSPQQQLEEQKSAQPPESSRTEDRNSPQQQLEEHNLAQQQVSTRTEDGNSPQQQLEDQSLAQPIESSRTEGRSSPQPQANSRPDEGNSPQPQENSIPEDGNSSQVETNSRLEDGNLPQPELNSKLEDRTSQQQDNSILEDGNSTQPQVNLRSEEGSLPEPLVNSTLEDQNSAQQLAQPVSDDLHSHQPDEPSNLDVQQEDDRPSSLIHMPEANSDDLHSHQQAGPSNLDVLQEDDRPSSPIHRQGAVASTGYQHSVDVTVEPSMEDRFKINLASKSKQEKQEIRWKLEGELDVVRSLVKRIEVKQGHVGGYGNSNVVLGGAISNGVGAKRAHSEVASAGVSRQFIRPMQHQLSFPMLHNSRGVSENVEKEKRMPKANQFYHSSEFLLAKDKFPPAESNKKSKLNWKRQGGGEMGHGLRMGSKFFKSCSSLLEKLMKHKHGWVFNSPVDVEALGLHDYFTIITHPMDLGTVKTRLNKNWYKSPKEFAEDVRLTFRNAMTYNPKGQDVHVMAENLSKIFEDRWAIIESDYNREMRYGMEYGAPSPLPRRVPGFTPPALDMRRILDRSESLARTPRSMSNTPSSRTPAPKKPKAKDPHKRDMTYEEKQKLSTNLQSLPVDKLDAIVQIIKRKNLAVNQQGDEIEVDIDSVDAETLWELDRFVTNYKKSLSKNKRRAELAQARAEALQNAMQKSQPPAMVEIPRETQADERNVPSSLPMQAGSQADNRSRSSSSSSSSSDSGSSSSDSDSDSSSSSGSDAGSQQT